MGQSAIPHASEASCSGTLGGTRCAWEIRNGSDKKQQGARMLKMPVPGSEELLERIKERLGPERKPLLIAVDGPDGVGKSSLASWLAFQLGMPTVHLDLYIVRDSRPLRWITDEVARIIAARTDKGRPIIVEGIGILDVLAQIGKQADFVLYVRGEGGHTLRKMLAAYRRRHNIE